MSTTKAVSRMPIDRTSWTVRQVSDVLRHLDYPTRLQQNVVVYRFFEGAANTRHDAREAISRISAILSNTLRYLTPRQRAIIERCDLNHETHASVIRALAISRRYFYRERSRALSILGRNLQADEVALRSPAITVVDPLQAELSLAETLAQVGSADKAASRLETVSKEASEFATRINAACLLVEIESRAGMEAHARRHMALLNDLVRQVPRPSAVTIAKVNATLARHLYTMGSEREAESIAKRALRDLRAAARLGFTEPGSAEAFVAASFVIVGRFIERSDRRNAQDAASEAVCFVKETNNVQPLVRIRAALTSSAVSMGPPNNIGNVDALEQLRAEALQFGLVAEAGVISATIAAIHRLYNRPTEALATLLPLRPIFQGVLSGQPSAAVLLQLAGAYLDTGSPTLALPLIRNARNDVHERSFENAVSWMYEARASLALDDTYNALSSVQLAIEYLTSLDRPRKVAVALRVQAASLWAVGESVSARDRIDRSIRLLEDFGNSNELVGARSDALRMGCVMRSKKRTAARPSLKPKGVHSERNES